MSESVRYLALSALLTRLAAIRKVDGYNTDAGLLIFAGESPSLGPSDAAEALALVVRDDRVKYQGENVHTALPVDVQALVKVGTPGTLLAIERVVEDVKRAVETPDRTLGGILITRGLTRGVTRSLERENGGEFVGAAVEYTLEMAERWGGQ